MTQNVAQDHSPKVGPVPRAEASGPVFGVVDIERDCEDLIQDGAFPGADGILIRPYDDVVILRDIVPENDPEAAYFLPAGGTGTVLFFSAREDGPVWMELNDWVQNGVVCAYELRPHLRLHLLNEQKYPRFGLTAEQVGYGWEIARALSLGEIPAADPLVLMSRALVGGRITDETGKTAVLTALFRFAAGEAAEKVRLFTGRSPDDARKALEDIH